MTVEEVRTNLRLPGDLYERIKQIAADERRSANAQMVVLLQEALLARQARKEQPRQ